jgi:hypothetical protein
MGCKFYCLLLQQEIFSCLDETESEFALHNIIEVPLPAVCKQLCSTAVSCDLSEHSIARKNYMGCGVDFSIQATCSIILQRMLSS